MSSRLKTKKSLAILPFRFHHAKETDDTVLSEGIADSLATWLYNIKGLEVSPPSLVRKVIAEAKDSFSAGKLLQVDYILEGYIFPAKDKRRFTVQLLNIPDKSVLWAAQFDEKEIDLFQLEDRISERIAKAVQPLLEISHSEPITDSVPVQNTDEIMEAKPEESELRNSDGQQTEKRRADSPYPLVGLIVLIAALGGFLLWYGGFIGVANQPHANENTFLINEAHPKILVLPLQNAGVQLTDNSIGAGIAETLTRSLGNTKKLFVLSANAGRDASRIERPVSEIGRKFNVDYLLRGKFRRLSELSEIQVTTEFVESKSEKVLWTKEFRATDDDWSGLNAKIVAAVLESLSIEISQSDVREIAKQQKASGVAYEIYLAGRYQMASRSQQGLHKAIDAFSQAIEKDPNFALAYVGLADAYALRNTYEMPPPPDAYENAKKNARRALELDPHLAEAHATLGYILFFSEHNAAESEREFLRAIELNPSYATTHHWFGLTLAALGRHEEAVQQMEIAQKLDPQSIIVSTAKAMVHFYARQYLEGISECEKVVAIDAGFVLAHKTRRWIYQAENNYSEALADFQKEKNFSGSAESAGWLVIEAQVEALGSQKDKARELLGRALKDDFLKNNPRAFAYEVALAYAFLDETEKAVEWLEKAEDSQNHSFNFVKVDPRLDKIRSNVRYLNLVKKAGK